MYPLALQCWFGQNTCNASICSVLVSFIDTAYRSMLVFSTHPDFPPPVKGVYHHFGALLQGVLISFGLATRVLAQSREGLESCNALSVFIIRRLRRKCRLADALLEDERCAWTLSEVKSIQHSVCPLVAVG